MNRFVRNVATWMAMAGGIVLCTLVVMTCISIIGRLMNGIGHSDFLAANLPFLTGFFQLFGPIQGDFEIVEAGIAFSIMAFVPLCQLNRAHATVDLLEGFFSVRLNRFLEFLWETVFAFVLVIIAWRLYVGTTDKMRYNETTFLLQFPVWWGYAACTVAACIAAVVALYCVWTRFEDLTSKATTSRTDHDGRRSEVKR